MTSRRDPVENAADDGRDLYDIATWEPRTALDRVSVVIYWLITRTAKALVVGTALLILLSLGILGALADPVIGILTALSAVPALGLVAYVWYSNVTESEPLSLLVATFLLAVLTAMFAAVVNSGVRAWFGPFETTLAMIAFFFLVVGPGEEAVKLLAVWLYAYKDERFDAVIDGVVYGAVAGLGFATIENALYIARNVDAAEVAVGFALVGAGDGIAALRALAGPGHVIYSAFAGYYLGLAKFNPGRRGPIVVKGLIIAAAIHATYNTTVGVGASIIGFVTGLGTLPSFFLYILLFDGLFAFVLLRKIWRYRAAYDETRDAIDEDTAPEMTEFE